MKRICTLLCACIALGPLGAFAQGFGISQEQLVIDVRPQVIQPNFPVTFEVTSYATDINRAYVSYIVDGQVAAEGVGLKEFSVDAPRVGQTMQVEVNVRTVDQGTMSETFTLSPAQVDLLYEATDSHAPAMYRGKKLPAHQGGVRMVAMPYFVDQAGRKLDPDSLIYTWRVDGNVQQDASGYGQQVFEFEGPEYYRDRRVSVEVGDVSARLEAEREITLPTYEPVIRFYPENPLWSTDYSSAITADRPLRLSAQELAVRAVPFFVSNADSYDMVEYEWILNNTPTQVYGDRNVFNLRAPSEGSGSATIELKLEHNRKLLQVAHSIFQVVFGAEAQSEDGSTNANFFGNN